MRREGNRNKKLMFSLFLIFLLCVVLLVRGEGGSLRRNVGPTPTPTIELPRELFNVWVVEAEKTEITVLYDGEAHTYPLTEALSAPLAGCIADLTVEHGRVTRLKIKQNTVEAKVLRIGADFIELEGYGVVALAENSRVYRTYAEGMENGASVVDSAEGSHSSVTEAEWVDVVVGYTTSAFVVDGDKICAALIRKEVDVTSIRVLLQTASYGGYFHESVECGSESRFYLSDGNEKTVWLDAGEKIDITPELVASYGGRVYMGTQKEEGKLALYNVKRAIGVPSYRGTLEITLQNGKLLVVNEVSLEEYLYGVLPSEMPESFGEEALKAQAVCARSYACNQLLANRYCAYGAHVDDSMTCQVYQNYGETEGSVRAVKATFGKVLEMDGKCITAYYFSCSYGHTSDSMDVWGENAGTFLNGVAQTSGTVKKDLTTEAGFVEFLNSEGKWYDSDSVWFRWETVLGSELDEVILKRLQERQAAAPEAILLLTGQSETELKFSQGVPEKFGTLEGIEILERSESGLITRLLLRGSEASYLLQKEYNIRYVLAPKNSVYLKNGSTSNNMTLLPSAYFTVEAKNNLFLISGGGYGHGVGMSQYGAKHLAADGWSFDEILAHFYKETELAYLY